MIFIVSLEKLLNKHSINRGLGHYDVHVTVLHTHLNKKEIVDKKGFTRFQLNRFALWGDVIIKTLWQPQAPRIPVTTIGLLIQQVYPKNYSTTSHNILTF